MPRKKEKRGRPRTRFPPTRQQYQQMVTACINALVHHRKFIVLVVPKSLRLEGMGFPRMYPQEREDHYTINARILLDWLHKKGHCPFDGDAFVAQRRATLMRLWNMENKIDKLGDFGHNVGTKASEDATNEGNNDGLL